jgi:outer membrane protein TolC
MLSLMVGATVPIWAGSRQKQMRIEAEAMREMAVADLASIKAETQARVLEIVADLDRVVRLTALYRGTVLPQAGATVSSALAAYQVGSVDFMTVLDNQMKSIGTGSSSSPCRRSVVPCSPNSRC